MDSGEAVPHADLPFRRSDIEQTVRTKDFSEPLMAAQFATAFVPIQRTVFSMTFR